MDKYSLSILCILFPLFSFCLLILLKNNDYNKISSIIGTTSVGLSTLFTLLINIDFFKMNHFEYYQNLWNWIKIGSFSIDINFMIDGLSLTMLSIVTGVGFLIHIFSNWYMHGEKETARFFAYTNLFIASMIILVLAGNLLLMYVGWELVGVCSYLLIGFYYTHIKNGLAALKAFLITRIADVCLIIAIFIIYHKIGSLNFNDIFKVLTLFTNQTDIFHLKLAAVLLLCGAIGKSAQFPMQTWLADAMVAPTPVSALIHAATMITAGVYLIVRTHVLFHLMPDILYLILIIGSITLILGSFEALIQNDIKRVLAYSTMSQIGYMFAALGIEAWHAAIFHLMTHAFFKALLFLSSGSIILECNQEQNMLKMGGLRKKMPMIYLCFLMSGASLAAVPFITSGFFSKEEIVLSIFYSGHIYYAIIGLLGAFLTSLYTFRMIFLIFHGKPFINSFTVINHSTKKGITYYFPLLIMLIFSTYFGTKIRLPINTLFPAAIPNEIHSTQLLLILISSSLVILGCVLSWIFFNNKKYRLIILEPNSFHWWNVAINSKLLTTWTFDGLYRQLFIKPYLIIAKYLKSDPLNRMLNIPVIFLNFIGINLLFRSEKSNQINNYITSIIFGTGLILVFLLLFEFFILN
ncbi:MAG: NADH-quinone oxidoreductase subunit L [Candidatus Dasytiphilus stammeri]